MLRWLDERLPLSTLVTLFPLTFLVHDGEEILTIESWLATNGARLKALTVGTPFEAEAASAASMNTAAFAGAVFTLLLLILLCTCLMRRSLRQDRPNWLAAPFLTMTTIYALNILTHLGQSALWGGYTPGVVTAVLVMIPYCAYLYRRLFQASVLTARRLLLSIVAALIVGMPMVLAAHEIGRILAP